MSRRPPESGTCCVLPAKHLLGFGLSSCEQDPHPPAGPTVGVRELPKQRLKVGGLIEAVDHHCDSPKIAGFGPGPQFVQLAVLPEQSC